MKKVLIDSDVLLDVFFDRQPFSKFAEMVLIKCENKQLQGFVTPVIISNVYYLLKKGSTHEKVIKKITQLLSIIDVLIIDKQIILKALNSDFKDFEDALQNYAAENALQIDLILTRNIKDYKNSKIAVMTPEDFCKIG